MGSVAGIKARAADLTLPGLLNFGGPAFKSEINYLEWFQPVEVTRVVLLPDGRKVAYALREGSDLSVMIVAVDGSEQKPTLLRVLSDEDVNRQLTVTSRGRLARIGWMKWVTNNRLVLETNRQTVTGSSAVLPTGLEYGEGLKGGPTVVKAGSVNWMSGEIIAFNSDGSDLRQLVKPSDIAAQAVTLVGTMDVARAPYALALDPDRSGSVIFSAWHFPDMSDRQTARIERMRVDISSGKITSLDQRTRRRFPEPLRDQQGRERLLLEKPSDTDTGVFQFTHFGGVFPKTKDELLDACSGKPEDRGFGYTAAEFWGERVMPLGFDRDPAVLYYASNVGRDTLGVYGVNLLTRERLDVAVEDPRLDMARMRDDGFGAAELVIDPYQGGLAGVRAGPAGKGTVWTKPLLQAMQEEIDGALPEKENRILEWDERQAVFLVETRSRTEPGVFYVYDSEKQVLMEVVKRVPKFEAKSLSRVVEFSCAAADGVVLHGVLTLPEKTKTVRAPLVVLAPESPFAAMPKAFDAEAQAFAAMGMAVLRVNVRGAEGLGRAHRESLKRGYETAQVADLLTAMDYAAANFSVSRRLTAIMGREYGAYLALRAAELHPKRFRCVLAADTIIDWGKELTAFRSDEALRAFWGGEEQAKKSSAWPEVEKIEAAVLLLTEDFTEAAAARDNNLGEVRKLAGALKGQGTTAERFNLSTPYAMLPAAEKAGVFGRIEAFFNLHLFNYTVDLGETRVIEDKP
jgi:dipeptidyl aminopeptidase/acylaminoacyl peptidase